MPNGEEMRAPLLGSASAVPPSRRPVSSNQPSGWLGGANHQNDCLAEPSPMVAASNRGAPSTVRPFQISILPAPVKPASAWLSSFWLALLAPVEARLVARPELAATLTTPTDPATTEREPGPLAEVALGTLDTRSSSFSVALGASLKP